MTTGKQNKPEGINTEPPPSDSPPPPPEQLPERLLKCDAVLSLTGEREIFNSLQQASWKAAHSVYYEDQKEKKWRETDIIARRSWARQRKSGTQYCTINLTIECKSVKDYNIIFAPETLDNHYSAVQAYWFPGEGRLQKLASNLETTELNSKQTSLFIRNLEELAFPNGRSLLMDFETPHPKAPLASTAFKETNIKVDKDLDASVLWRANQSLRSAIDSFRKTQFENDYSSLQDIMQTARRTSNSVHDSAMAFANKLSHEINVFHPIIVIESRLWKLHETHLDEIPWCRHVHIDRTGVADWWVDVVGRSHFEKYSAQLTKHYELQMSKTGARQLKAPRKPMFY
ncbi:hypothetical protein [Corallococcus exercitus]|uniref:hypothetical protein n=1 Tax=Corallococcus exercitus TaxID=2316736 RepID=UPI0035D40518